MFEKHSRILKHALGNRLMVIGIGISLDWMGMDMGKEKGGKMKEILMMVLADCPYCRQAEGMIKELQEENVKLRIKRVDEEENPKLAETLDYYYVPSFFVDGKKLMEGVPTKEKVKAVLDAAME